MQNQNQIVHHSIGRRKCATARIFLIPGDGKITINNRKVEDYFPYAIDRKQLIIPLLLVDLEKEYDILVKVQGGGRKGQLDAIRLGIARAICLIDKNKRVVLKQQGFLSRDARIKERRKYGLKKARKASQYSKR
jgi:small subunit ribosomal protein S9